MKLIMVCFLLLIFFNSNSQLKSLKSTDKIVSDYQSMYQKGVNSFGITNYETALTYFERALELFGQLKEKNLTSVDFDTTATLYAGYSAQNAKMYDKAKEYYKILISKSLFDTSYVGIYRFMINSNLEGRDTAEAKNYLAISKQRFPQYSDIWLDYETLFLTEKKPERFFDMKS